MKVFIQTADSKGRVALPGCAHATLLVERIDSAEYRIRKVKGPLFHEENFPLQLTERDAIRVAESLANPCEPNRAARRAAKKFRKTYG